MPDPLEAKAKPTAACDEELVEVFGTQQESEAMVVRALLESEGIAAVMLSLEAPQDVLPGVGGVAVRVRASQAEQARRVIADYQQTPVAVEEEEEPEPPLSEDSQA